METLKPNKGPEFKEYELYLFDFGTHKIVTRGRTEEEAKIAMFHDLDRNSPLYGSGYTIKEVKSLPPDVRSRIESDYERTHPNYKITKPWALE